MITFSWRSIPTPTEEKDILEVFLSSFLPQGRASEEYLSDYFYQKIIPRLRYGNMVSAAFDGNIWVAFAIFEKWDERSYYLAEMAVLPDYQRQGIGKKLVFSILEKEPTTQKILLVTEELNRWSQSFYEKIGFIPSSFQHPDYPKQFIGYEFCLASS